MPSDPPPAGASGVFYAFRILIGAFAVWRLLESLGDGNPVWGLVSFVVVSEPELQPTLANFRARFLGTLVGSAIGLATLFALPGPGAVSVPVGMSLAVLVYAFFFRVAGNWKIAPVTVALVMTSGVAAHTEGAAWDAVQKRTVEVLLGSLVAVVVTGAAYLPGVATGRFSEASRHAGGE